MVYWCHPPIVSVSASLLLKLYGASASTYSHLFLDFPCAFAVIRDMTAYPVIWASSGIFLVLLDGLEDARTEATFAFQAPLLPFSLSSGIVAVLRCFSS
jgi:hypothetical protein